MYPINLTILEVVRLSDDIYWWEYALLTVLGILLCCKHRLDRMVARVKIVELTVISGG